MGGRGGACCLGGISKKSDIGGGGGVDFASVSLTTGGSCLVDGFSLGGRACACCVGFENISNTSRTSGGGDVIKNRESSLDFNVV